VRKEEERKVEWSGKGLYKIGEKRGE